MALLPLRHPGIAILIAFGFALLALGTDIIAPALPDLAAGFGIGVRDAQASLAVFVIAFAISQLFFGPFSDRFGRRPVLLFGAGIFLAGSLACTFAPSIGLLLVGRAVQGVGCCAASVIGRAILRDVHGEFDTAGIMAYVTAGAALLIVAGPFTGGLLAQHFGWRAVFAFLSVLAGALLLCVALLLRESNDHRDPAATGLRRVGRNFLALLGDRRYVGHVAALAFTYGAIIAFLSESPFLLIDRLTLTPAVFGLLYGGAVAGYVTGSFITARLAPVVGSHRLLGVGTILVVAAGIGFVGTALSGSHSPAALFLPWLVFLFGTGFNQPTALAGAIAPHPRIAGTASALLGFLQLATGAAVGLAIGQLRDGTALPMAVTILVMACGTFASYWFVVRPTRGR